MERLTGEKTLFERPLHDEAGKLAPLEERWWRTVRAAWFVAVGLTLVILLASLPAAVRAVEQGAYLQSFMKPIFNNPGANPTILDIVVTMIGVLVSLGGALLSLILAAVIFWRRSRDRMAVFVSFYLLWTAIVNNGPLEVMEFYIPGMAVFTTDVLSFSGTILSIALLSLFPDGRFVPRWTRWLLLASVMMLPIALFSYLRYGQFLTSPLFPAALLFWGAVELLAFYAQVCRYRYVSSPTERQQTKWFVFGFGLWMALSLLTVIPYILGRNLSPGESLPLRFILLGVGVYVPSLVIMPIALTVAVLRYRLWDIDILINRTLVYSVLTVAVVSVYVLVVGTLGTLFHAGGNIIISLIATGVVALLFQPLREALQRRANRLMFGEREDPYAVLERLSERLDLVVQTEQILPTIVETVVHALKLPYGAITLRHGDVFNTVAEYFRSSAEKHVYEESEILPLVYQSETVGQLVLAPRAPGEVFSQTDRQLLDTIARQTSIAAYNVRLTDELQRSREQLVTTREEERRRLRRDLHDGLGPVLATISVAMDAIHNLADNPDASRDVAIEVKSQAQEALEDIRRIAYDLRPPALDEFGLMGALKQHVEATNHVNGLHITFDNPNMPPQLPAAVEVAAYRIALESITNVQRHAQAQECRVRMMADRDLLLEISDDGCGIPKSVQSGVGLNAMRERAAELGGSCRIQTRPEGGTTVMVRLPLPQNYVPLDNGKAQWTPSAS
jgi:signal transduction histidine kinase